jgi:hypothetical protein
LAEVADANVGRNSDLSAEASAQAEAYSADQKRTASH